MLGEHRILFFPSLPVSLTDKYIYQKDFLHFILREFFVEQGEWGGEVYIQIFMDLWIALNIRHSLKSVFRETIWISQNEYEYASFYSNQVKLVFIYQENPSQFRISLFPGCPIFANTKFIDQSSEMVRDNLGKSQPFLFFRHVMPDFCNGQQSFPTLET